MVGVCVVCLCALRAVVSLRQCERQAERAREQERAAQALQSEHALKEITLLNKQLKDKDRDRNLLLVSTHVIMRRHPFPSISVCQPTSLCTSVQAAGWIYLLSSAKGIITLKQKSCYVFTTYFYLHQFILTSQFAPWWTFIFSTSSSCTTRTANGISLFISISFVNRYWCLFLTGIRSTTVA